MKNFEYYNPVRILFGAGEVSKVGKEAAKLGQIVCLVSYKEPGFLAPLLEKVKHLLEEESLRVCTFYEVEENPEIRTIERGVALCCREKVDLVIGVGGGSAMDAAKVVAAGVFYEGDLWNMVFSRHSVNTAVSPERALPTLMVPTLPATGSEGSNGSVLNNPETGESADVMADFLRPAFTLMNPDLTLTIPKRQTVFGIIDMFSHVLERYFSSSVDVHLTDYMCEGVMKAILVNARALMENLDDYNARAEFMWTAIVAHNGLLAAGRNQDWATHTIGAQLSAQYNAVHGSTRSVLFPCWAKYVYKENLPRFVQFANRVFDVEIDFYDQEKTALEGIRRLKEFFQSMGAPVTLKEIGVESDETFRKMAEDACRFGNIGGLKALNADDVEVIYKMAQ